MTLTIFCMVCVVGCGSHTCARCHENFTGAAYQNVVIEGGGVLCEDCAGYEYGADMDLYRE